MNKLIKKLPEALDPLFSSVSDLKTLFLGIKICFGDKV